MHALTMIRVKELPKAISAPRLFFAPSIMETLALDPAPISTPMAAEMFITGKVMVSPVMASVPTPCPMKIRSITL